MVHDIGIGNREDHSRAARADPGVEQILQIDDVRRAVGTGLRVHAMVGSQREHCTRRVEPREVAVHHRVERVRAFTAGCELVLNVVGGRQVHQIRALRLHQLHACGEHELRELGAVYRRHRSPDESDYVLDTVIR